MNPIQKMLTPDMVEEVTKAVKVRKHKDGSLWILEARQEYCDFANDMVTYYRKNKTGKTLEEVSGILHKDIIPKSFDQGKVPNSHTYYKITPEKRKEVNDEYINAIFVEYNNNQSEVLESWR